MKNIELCFLLLIDDAFEDYTILVTFGGKFEIIFFLLMFSNFQKKKNLRKWNFYLLFFKFLEFNSNGILDF